MVLKKVPSRVCIYHNIIVLITYDFDIISCYVVHTGYTKSTANPTIETYLYALLTVHAKICNREKFDLYIVSKTKCEIYY